MVRLQEAEAERLDFPVGPVPNVPTFPNRDRGHGCKH